MADRYFLPQTLRPGLVQLSGDEAKHLARVARREVGEMVELFDGQGHGASARIVSIEKQAVTLEILGFLENREPRTPLTLAVAVPKGDRFDWLVEKATEIGVSRLVPLRSERSVVDPRGSKLDRLRRVIIEASKQSGRNRLMILEETSELGEYLRKETARHRFFAHAGGSEISQFHPNSPDESTAMAIGPEGGWSDAEVELAVQLGCNVLGLGTTRLRVETAAIVASAVVLSHFGGSGQ